MRTFRISLELLAIWLSLAGGTSFAQPTFVEVTPTDNSWFQTNADEDFWINSIAPADVDADGDLDLAVIGFYVVYNVSAEDKLLLFMNDGPDADGNWIYTPVEVSLGNAFAGASDLSWGDFDADGYPDLAVASEGVTQIYHNQSGTLVLLQNELPAYWEDSAYTIGYDLRSLSWADFDNDGDLDLFLPSVFDYDVWEYQTDIVRNDGADDLGGWLFSVVVNAADATMHAQSAWADHDGDGDLDLFLMENRPNSGEGFINIYDNTQGTLAVSQTLGVQVNHGMADWGDYDADGDMDIVVCGNIQEVDGSYATVLRVYTNNGDGYAETNVDFGFGGNWLDLLATTWADYDSDGDMDLLLTGSYVDYDLSEIRGKSDIYLNDNGVFTAMNLNLPAPFDTIGRGGSFTWLDIDNDGDLDYLVAGAYFVEGGNGLVEAQIHLYRNDTIFINGAPSTPGQLSATPDGSSVRLNWMPASDDGTPGDALTYSLQIRRADDAFPADSRQLPEPGNVSAAQSWQIHGLADGTYVWNLSAVDSAFNAGDKAEGMFTIGAVPVTVSVEPARMFAEFIVFKVTLINQTEEPQTHDLWVEMTDANGTVVNTVGPLTIQLAAGSTVDKQMRQRIPTGLPPGIYTENIYVGTFPDAPIASDSFEWTKRK